MSNTTNLSLFKHDNPSTNTNAFDIERALNENWDKVDTYAGNTNTTLSNKVDKVTGKGLSTNDFTNAEKQQVATNKTNIATNKTNIATLQAKVEEDTERVNQNTIRQDALERVYDEQIRELANQNPQLPEIVDARQGMSTLGSIIKKKIFHFDNVAEMKDCLTLVPGDVVQTLGYYEENDGGEGLYKIVDDNTLVDDGGSIHTLNNGLKATLIMNNEVNVKQFGAKGDGVTDDTNSIQICLNLCKKIFIPKGIYRVQNIVANNTVELFGVYSHTIIKPINNVEGILLTINGFYSYIHDIDLDGMKSQNTNILTAIANGGNPTPGDKHILLENLNVHHFSGDGIAIKYAENRIINCYCYRNNGYGILHTGSDSLYLNNSCAWNYAGGIRENGASNKWVNCKCFVNGESENTTLKPHNENAYGFRISDSFGSEFIGCDAQENYSHGFYVSSYKNVSMISCNADNNGMINKDTENEEDFLHKYGFIFTNCKNAYVIGFANNFRYQQTGVYDGKRWQYGALAFGDKNNESCDINITALNQIENIVYTTWDVYVTMQTKNKIKVNCQDWQQKIYGGMIIEKDRNNTARVDFGNIADEANTFRVVKSTDNSFRLLNYKNGALVSNGNILQVNVDNGMIVGSSGLGFFGKIPVSKATAKANATDLASAIELVNDLKYQLTRLGLIN